MARSFGEGRVDKAVRPHSDAAVEGDAVTGEVDLVAVDERFQHAFGEQVLLTGTIRRRHESALHDSRHARRGALQRQVESARSATVAEHQRAALVDRRSHIVDYVNSEVVNRQRPRHHKSKHADLTQLSGNRNFDSLDGGVLLPHTGTLPDEIASSIGPPSILDPLLAEANRAIWLVARRGSTKHLPAECRFGLRSLGEQHGMATKLGARRRSLSPLSIEQPRIDPFDSTQEITAWQIR